MLARQSRLRAAVEGEYPGADTLVYYDWLDERVAFRIPAQVFLVSANYNAIHLDQLLTRRVLEKVYARPAPVEVNSSSRRR